jgi:hypothetical protein
MVILYIGLFGFDKNNGAKISHEIKPSKLFRINLNNILQVALLQTHA